MAKKNVAVSLRKPPSPEKLDAFVAGGAEQPAPEAPSPRAAYPSPESEPTHVDSTPVCATAVAEGAPPPASASEPPASGVLAASSPSSPGASPGAPASSPPPSAGAPDTLPAMPRVEVGGRPLRAVTVYLPQALAERLTVHCIEQDRDLNNVIGDALEQHLQKRLGAGAWSPPSAREPCPEGDPAPPRSAPFRGDDPFRWVDPRNHPRIDRILHLSRVLVTLWRQRPWPA